jgi:hypothetical protein
MGAAGKRIPEQHDRPAFLAIAARRIGPGGREPARAMPARRPAEFEKN